MEYYRMGFFLMLLPITILIYQISPRKFRWFILLLVSLAYAGYFSGIYLIFTVIAALITYVTAVIIDAEKKKTKTLLKGLDKDAKKVLKKKQTGKQKFICVCGIIAVLGILLYLKYYNFFAENMNILFAKDNPVFKIKKLFLPLGISFYTLSAIGYIADVYWEKVEAQKNPLKLLLFLSFFPTIMEGPITSYTDINKELYGGKSIDIDNLAQGYIRIFWGLFKKIVIADRLYVIVTELFDNAGNYHGVYIVAAAIAYTLQLYMEFSGCIDIVIGSGKLFGITLPENFRQPFLAQDASEFWRRWHISLGVWFKTYIFFPVSTSKPAKKWNKFGAKHAGKYVTQLILAAMALFPVWISNGLWHGAAWSFICYGIYYFVIILIEFATKPLRVKFMQKINITEETVWFKWLRRAKTWVIIFTGELFFRADTLTAGIKMFKSLFRGFYVTELFDGRFLNMGLDRFDWIVIAAGLVVVSIVGVFREKHERLGEWIAKKSLPLRWLVYLCLIVGVVIFGVYGPGHEEVDLIYAGF